MKRAPAPVQCCDNPGHHETAAGLVHMAELEVEMARTGVAVARELLADAEQTLWAVQRATARHIWKTVLARG